MRTDSTNDMSEVWKAIGGHEEYEVSTYGRVRKAGTGIILKLAYDKDGYLTIGLTRNGKQSRHKVHRLVASAFIPNPGNKPCIDHINGVRDYNAVDNLRWCSVGDNNGFEMARMRKSKALIGRKKDPQAVERNRAAQHKRPICQYDLDGNLLRTWDSVRAIGRELGYARASITRCAKGVYERAYGCVWRYAQN